MLIWPFADNFEWLKAYYHWLISLFCIPDNHSMFQTDHQPASNEQKMWDNARLASCKTHTKKEQLSNPRQKFQNDSSQIKRINWITKQLSKQTNKQIMKNTQGNDAFPFPQRIEAQPLPHPSPFPPPDGGEEGGWGAARNIASGAGAAVSRGGGAQ